MEDSQTKRYTFLYTDKKGVSKEVDIQSRSAQWAEGKLRTLDDVKFIARIKSWPYNEVFDYPADILAY